MLALFDLDNTLVDRSAAIRRWAQMLAGHEGLSGDAVEAIVGADGEGEVPRPEFLAVVQALPGMRMRLKELQDWYVANYASCYLPDDNSVRALTMLRDAGWTIGVVTNGSKVRTVEKLARASLEPLIDALCVAEEYGIRKPDPRIFVEIARRCGVALDGWMIGDAPVEDICGAVRAGLRTAWVRRGRRWDEQLCRPDLEIDTVLEAAIAILKSE
ncbi:HAD family hydrolase [Micromonospora sp. 4G55]|uniref:HAD family hydrolase n=1 Tax=Micromonospora sp. 4G55 TaxID=2806102 RepID=UPI001A5318AE|nr:HAD family hydrolase [Micromonospora sp. 4G55]MBM0255537.1 HAD-IA family hydrolase [Micromonospora sp. 4G55]